MLPGRSFSLPKSKNQRETGTLAGKSGFSPWQKARRSLYQASWQSIPYPAPGSASFFCYFSFYQKEK